MGHRPLTQRCLCTPFTLRNIHIIFSRLHYRKPSEPSALLPRAPECRHPTTATKDSRTDTRTGGSRPATPVATTRAEAVAMERIGQLDQNWSEGMQLWNRRGNRPHQCPSWGTGTKSRSEQWGWMACMAGETTPRAGRSQRCHWPNWPLFLSQACPDPPTPTPPPHTSALVPS